MMYVFSGNKFQTKRIMTFRFKTWHYRRFLTTPYIVMIVVFNKTCRFDWTEIPNNSVGELKPLMKVAFRFLHLHHEFVTLEVVIDGEKSKGFSWVFRPYKNLSFLLLISSPLDLSQVSLEIYEVENFQWRVEGALLKLVMLCFLASLHCLLHLPMFSITASTRYTLELSSSVLSILSFILLYSQKCLFPVLIRMDLW